MYDLLHLSAVSNLAYYAYTQKLLHYFSIVFAELNVLITTIDEAKAEMESTQSSSRMPFQPLKKTRISGQPSTQPPPDNAPLWAVVQLAADGKTHCTHRTCIIAHTIICLLFTNSMQVWLVSREEARGLFQRFIATSAYV